MDHPNIDLVKRIYGAYLSGDRATMSEAFAPNVRWHNSGFDATSGDLVGHAEVFAYLFADNHLDDYRLDVLDILASDERVAVVARASGRIGERQLTNEFIQLIAFDDGRISEVWNYNWDQRALAEAMPVPA